jgi:mannitol/fructose-specific phosphotransferase system IIA component (Ntr-type)
LTQAATRALFNHGSCGMLIFSSDLIRPRLQATERFAAIRELIAHAVSFGDILADDEERVAKLVTGRETAMSSAMGHGRAAPTSWGDAHCGGNSILILGIAPEAIDWPSLDNQPVRVVLMALEGRNPGQDLAAARLIGNAISQRKIIEHLCACPTAEEMWSILKPHYQPHLCLALPLLTPPPLEQP